MNLNNLVKDLKKWENKRQETNKKIINENNRIKREANNNNNVYNYYTSKNTSSESRNARRLANLHSNRKNFNAWIKMRKEQIKIKTKEIYGE